MIEATRAGSTAALQGSSPAPDNDYVVKRGDTLWGIAREKGVSLAELEAANPQLKRNDLIFPGDHLTIPRGGTSDHLVRPGETVGRIAKANHVSVQAIVEANHLQNPNRIYVGDTLKIPSGERPASAVRSAPAQPTPATRTPAAPAPVATPQARPADSPDLRAMFDSRLGSSALGAVVIGQAEGTRTPDGGFRASYYSHVDPGNGVVNRGSFSLQHAEGLTPQQADARQLAKLSRQIPTFEAAARNAGLDPNNPALATAYLDLFNQSESAAGRFLNQLDYLKDNGISTNSLIELRVRSFVDHTTGERFRFASGTPVGGGFANIARTNLGRTPTEPEVQAVIRRDQTRRLTAMERALPQANAEAPAAPGSQPAAPRAPATTSGPARFGSNPGLDLTPAVISQTNALYDAVRRETGFSLHVTSGRRGPARQADAMYNNFADGSSPSYRNREAFAEVRAAYLSGRSEGLSRSGTIARMTAVLQAQSDRGVLISRHMSSKAIDIRMPPAADRAAVIAAIRDNPAVQSVGTEDDHLHIQFR